jgi:hypothetical protein
MMKTNPYLEVDELTKTVSRHIAHPNLGLFAVALKGSHPHLSTYMLNTCETDLSPLGRLNKLGISLGEAKDILYAL